jgi:hypothetical protein
VARVKPLVTIACDCGNVADVRLGRRLECGCGAVFRVAPAAAATELGRRHRRALALSLLLLLVAFAAPLLALDRGAALFVPLAALATWYGSVVPHLQARYQRQLARVPAWVVTA